MTATSVTVSYIEQLVYWLPKRAQRDIYRYLLPSAFGFITTIVYLASLQINGCQNRVLIFLQTSSCTPIQFGDQCQCQLFEVIHGMRVLMDDNCVLEFLILPTCSMNPETAVICTRGHFIPAFLQCSTIYCCYCFLCTEFRFYIISMYVL